jgi:hypothetical protein
MRRPWRLVFLHSTGTPAMTPRIVFVDVDDTLVRSVGAKRIPMPGVVAAVHALHRQGVALYLWSSGGADYARASAVELGLQDCFLAFLPKPQAYIDDQPVHEWRFREHVLPSNAADAQGGRGLGVNASTSFETDGCAFVPDVLSAQDCQDIASRIRPGPASGGTRSLLREPWCVSLAHRLCGHPALCTLIPSAHVAVQCSYFEKSSSRNWRVPVHQDLGVPVAERVDHPELRGWSDKEGALFVQAPVPLLEHLVAVRVHLDACLAEDGPLRVVPGSHVHGRLGPADAVALRDAGTERVCVADQGAAWPDDRSMDRGGQQGASGADGLTPAQPGQCGWVPASVVRVFSERGPCHTAVGRRALSSSTGMSSVSGRATCLRMAVRCPAGGGLQWSRDGPQPDSPAARARHPRMPSSTKLPPPQTHFPTPTAVGPGRGQSPPASPGSVGNKAGPPGHAKPVPLSPEETVQHPHIGEGRKSSLPGPMAPRTTDGIALAKHSAKPGGAFGGPHNEPTPPSSPEDAFSPQFPRNRKGSQLAKSMLPRRSESMPFDNPLPAHGEGPRATAGSIGSHLPLRSKASEPQPLPSAGREAGRSFLSTGAHSAGPPHAPGSGIPVRVARQPTSLVTNTVVFPRAKQHDSPVSPTDSVLSRAHRKSSASASSVTRTSRISSVTALAAAVKTAAIDRPAWAQLNETEREVTRSFVLPDHLKAISMAARRKNIAISFREAGAVTLMRILAGAPTKGHDMLEKTIKDSSVREDFKTRAAVRLAESAGHWEDGVLKGVYLNPEFAKGVRASDPGAGRKLKARLQTHEGRPYYPVDASRLEESLRDLRAVTGWEEMPATDDPGLRLAAKLGDADRAEAWMKEARAEGIEAYVGPRENGVLKGLYVSPEVLDFAEGRNSPAEMKLKSLLETRDGKSYFPVDTDRLAESLVALKDVKGWERLIFTGDYDLHDMISFTAHASPVPSDSDQEKGILEFINSGVTAVDENRPAGAKHLRVVQHGPQYNYVAFTLVNESRQALVKAVADPSFPLAMCDRGEWMFIRDQAELETFYKDRGVHMKATWLKAGESTASGTASPARRASAADTRSKPAGAEEAVDPGIVRNTTY